MATNTEKKSAGHKEQERYDKGVETQERLLEAADELFITRGFDGVSVNDVAQHAGVAKALVFYYFKSKQELFDAVLDRYYQSQAQALMDAMGNGARDTRERIHAGIDAYLDFIEKNPGYSRLIQREICSSSRNLNKIMQYMAPLYQWGQSVFGGLLRADGPLSAKHFFMTIFGMAINYYTYAPVLGPLWGVDPMGKKALAERREHVHAMLETLLDAYLQEYR
jgi:AcrR family transcriptional regulator